MHTVQRERGEENPTGCSPSPGLLLAYYGYALLGGGGGGGGGHGVAVVAAAAVRVGAVVVAVAVAAPPSRHRRIYDSN